MLILAWRKLLTLFNWNLFIVKGNLLICAVRFFASQFGDNSKTEKGPAIKLISTNRRPFGPPDAQWATHKTPPE